jgi:hypothetical protein
MPALGPVPPDPGVDAGLGAAPGREQHHHHDLVQLAPRRVAYVRSQGMTAGALT